MAVLFIGVALGNQLRDHRDHLADIGRRARHDGRLQHPKRSHIIEIPADCFLGDRGDRTAGLGRARVDIVIHIGEVAHIGDGIGPIDMP
jgi:hypothetical protein